VKIVQAEFSILNPNYLLVLNDQNKLLYINLLSDLDN